MNPNKHLPQMQIPSTHCVSSHSTNQQTLPAHPYTRFFFGFDLFSPAKMSLSAAPTRQLACSGCHRKLSRHLCNVTRRQASTALLSGAAAVARPPHAQALPPPRPSTCAPLDPALAKAFLEAVYSTVEQQQVCVRVSLSGGVLETCVCGSRN